MANYEANFELNRNTLEFQGELSQNHLHADLIVDYRPSKTSQLVNDSGYITILEVPTKLSQFTNDTGFITVTALIPIENNIIEIESDIVSLQTALNGKQAQLTQTQLNAVNSGANITNIGQIAANTSDISNINSLIPNQASASNQLADKGFVNSSISTNTAYFVGTFNSVAELEAYSGTLTNNDYAFVRTTDIAGNTLYDRYKWNGTEWLFEYELNNSSFTAQQWAAINSNITASATAQIATNADNIADLQNAISNMQTTNNLVTSVSSSSTDSQYPSAKLFYDTCGDIESTINAIRGV